MSRAIVKQHIVVHPARLSSGRSLFLTGGSGIYIIEMAENW